MSLPVSPEWEGGNWKDWRLFRLAVLRAGASNEKPLAEDVDGKPA